jgi:signal peptidase I
MGGFLLMAGLISAWLANQFPAIAPIPPLIWTLSCYHVYKTFPNLRRQQSVAISLLILGLFLVRLVLGSTPNWVNQSYVQCIVPSDSMVPTLQVGDRLFMHRDRLFQPQPGDIVIFEPPDTLRSRLPAQAADSLFVKRIIGLPGQTVQVDSGRVLVDGQPLAERYVQSPPLYQWGPEVVPADSYFVLGDNRNNSSDSHIWGYVPKDKLLGKAYKIYWPPERIQSLD